MDVPVTVTFGLLIVGMIGGAMFLHSIWLSIMHPLRDDHPNDQN